MKLHTLHMFVRKIYPLLFIFTLFFSMPVWAQQVALNEDFEDENLTENPAWTGDLDDFTFVDESGNTLLRLDADGGDRSEITTLSSAAYGSWDFFIRVPATSSFNRVYVYLISDSDVLDIVGSGAPGDANGYAIHTGGGNFDLVRLDNGSTTSLLSSNTTISENQGYQVRVTRNQDDEWQLFVSEGLGSEPVSDSGIIVDGTHTESTYFGLYARYSSGNRENYFFDDIIISEPLEEFVVEEIFITRANELEITFSNEVSASSFDATDFTLNNGIGNPASADLIDDKIIRLSFSDFFPDGDYILTINNVEDTAGQVIVADTEIPFTVENPFDVESVDAITSTRIAIEFTRPPDTNDLEVANFEIREAGQASFVNPQNIDYDAGENDRTVFLNLPDALSIGDYELTINDIFSESGWPLRDGNVFGFLVENPFQVADFDVLSRTDIEITFTQNIQSGGENSSNYLLNDTITPQSATLLEDNRVLLQFENPMEEGFQAIQISGLESAENWVIENGTTVEFTLENNFDLISIDLFRGNEITLEFTDTPDEATLLTSNFDISGSGKPAGIVYDSAANPNRVVLELNTPLFSGDYTLTTSGLLSNFGWPLSGGIEFPFSVENPFFVTNFEILSRSEFEITFSQDVQTADASNFVITGFGSPDNISQPSADVVQIEYSSPVEVGERELIINNVVSEQDWEIEANTIIEFSLFDTFEAGDLVISEFYYRVPIAWRTTEFDRPQYVEMYNRSNKLLNLRNFTLNGNNISNDTDLPIESGEYLVITRGLPVFEERFGDRNFVEADEFPTLNLTTSSTIEFATDADEIIETLTYEASSWGGNEVSLERYDFDVSSGFRDNWAESEDVLTGSPGLPNTVTAPTNSPEVVSVSFTAPRLIEITFSRTLSESSRQNVSAYSLDNGAVFTLVNETDNPRTLEFELTDRLEDQFKYTFSYVGIEDIFGNEVQGTETFNFTFVNPFRILAASVENGTDLLVQFTLPLTTESVNLSDFELGNGTAPNSFQFDDSETVRLTFADSFQTGSFEIVVNDIESFVPGLPEQWIIEENSTLEFFRFDEYQPGDIIVNEFMYRPPTDYPKYVELKNVSNRFLTIRDFELRRAEGASSNGGVISEFDVPIEPGGFVVVTESISLLETIFGSGPWVQMNNFPGYTLTTPDQIRFTDSDENLIEAISYDPSTWGGNGVSLERKSTDAPANDRNNWGQSVADLLGTPGDENTVDPDDGPELLSATFVDAETVRVTISGSLDFDAISVSNFSINRSPSIQSIEVVDGANIDLNLDQSMNSGTTYTITVNNIPDIFGNELSGAQASFTYYLVEEAKPGDILITEFMYNEPDGYSEYIELYNNSNKVFDLAGWQQANDTGTRREVTEEQTFLTPGSYIVLLRNVNILDFFPDIPFINAGSNLSALKNGGDEIVITNAENVTLDSLRYNPGWGGNGVALERRDLSAPTADQNNWGESLDPLLGTPGAPNSVDIDQDPPELLGADFVDERTVLLELTGAIDREATSRSNFTINRNRSITSIDFTTEGNILLNLDGSMNSGTEYTIGVSNLRDIFGNVLSSAQTSFTYYNIEIANPGDVVINEFMYNEPEDYTRYIELYNRSNKAVNLAGWRQANDTGTRRTLTEDRVILPPDSYIALLPNFNLLSVFPDIPALNTGSGLSALKNGGDNIVIVNADNVIIDSLRYSPDWGGNGVALERRRADLSPLFSENWAESPNEKFGTPGRANEVERNFNLLITGIEAVTRREVHIHFNAVIRENSAQRENFITNGVRPESVSLADGNRVILEFGSDLPTGPRTLSVSNVQTLGGFVIDESTEVTFTVFDQFEAGDVLVNEFMYRPPDDFPRYVELVNRSEKLLNLKNWRLQRRQTSGESNRFISAEDLSLEPGEFLVITDDVDLLVEAYGERKSVQMSSFPSFTLTVSDQIRLFTNANQRADSLAYEPSTWGGNGVALERLSLDVASELRANWAESPSPVFGTPGLPNDAQPDRTPPQIVRSSQFDDLGFRLVFNKQLDAETAMDIANYSIAPPLELSMIGFDETEVILFVDGELENNQVYSITVNGITDLFGTEIEPVTIEIRYLEFGEAAPGDLVINEILYRRLEAGSPEFVEVHNLKEVNVDLSGWILADNSGSAIIPGGVAIRENDYLVFTDTESFAAESEKIIYLSEFQSLSNTGDAVVLRDSDQSVVDSLFYQPDWGDNIPGISLERKDPNALSIDSANWAPSSDDRGSTPAEQNSRLKPDESPPEILFANLVNPDSVLVLFNEFIDISGNSGSAELAALISTGSVEQQNGSRFLLNGSETDVLDYNPLRGNRIILDASVVSPGEEIVVTAENLSDFQGNSTSTGTQPVAQPLMPGDLVINEIMFNPIADNRDGLPDQSDYIEIYNRMDYAISLEGIFLHDQPDENNEVSSIDPVTSDAKWIPSKGYALFYPEPENIPFSESRTALFFGITEELAPFTMQASRTTLSLPNSGRQVFLADSNKTMIDMVEYSESWHNPNIIDTRGIALERVNPNLESNSPENWGSNASPRGGSPGSENSIFQVSGIVSTETGVFLDPNPFSPDDDGFDDSLFINYRLDEPDYLLRIRIYDRYGRLVRKLADGKPAGFEGSVIWDGRTDDGLKNRIGIYIILVEAFNSNSGRNRTFKETAVIARRF